MKKHQENALKKRAVIAREETRDKKNAEHIKIRHREIEIIGLELEARTYRERALFSFVFKIKTKRQNYYSTQPEGKEEVFYGKFPSCDEYFPFKYYAVYGYEKELVSFGDIELIARVRGNPNIYEGWILQDCGNGPTDPDRKIFTEKYYHHPVYASNK